MKKVGSSNWKSKTRQTSKNLLPPLAGGLMSSLAIGHQPALSLSQQDSALFRAFQSNVLSLISHELRTPLTGIMNALDWLEEEEKNQRKLGKQLNPSRKEWFRVARENAHRLKGTMTSLLDLAAIEGGVFHARLKEVDLIRIVQNRIASYVSLFQEKKVKILSVQKTMPLPILADPQKLVRAIDLCFQVIFPLIRKKSNLSLEVSVEKVQFIFSFIEGAANSWETKWTYGQVGYQSRMGAPTSVFKGVLQSEQAFLSRQEEGLSSEFLLIHELMRVHQWKLEETHTWKTATLSMLFPQLSPEEGLRAILLSRAYQVSTELGSVALALVSVPKDMGTVQFCKQIKERLFRSTDQAYAFSDREQVALVLDDCIFKNVSKLLRRIECLIGRSLVFGIAQCPEDGYDPSILLRLAQERLTNNTLDSK